MARGGACGQASESPDSGESGIAVPQISRSSEGNLGYAALREVCVSVEFAVDVGPSKEPWLAEFRGRVHRNTPSLNNLRMVRRFSIMIRSHADFLSMGK